MAKNIKRVKIGGQWATVHITDLDADSVQLQKRINILEDIVCRLIALIPITHNVTSLIGGLPPDHPVLKFYRDIEGIEMADPDLDQEGDRDV